MRAAVVAVLVLATALTASAQRGARAVNGVVRDSVSGRALAGVVVEVHSAAFQQTSRTDADGEFHLVGIPSGTMRFSARRIGYAVMAQELRLADRDTTLVVRLQANAQLLDTTRVRANVTGIYGSVGTSVDVRPLDSVKIQVVGATRETYTDTSGRYFVELKKGGKYFVRVSRAGFGTQILPADVPTDRTVEVTALLETTADVPPKDAEALAREFDRRLAFRGLGSAEVPGEELVRNGRSSLSDALRTSPSFNGRGLQLGATICLFVNGVPKPGVPLDAIPVESIQAVEAYAPRGDPTNTLAMSWPSSPCPSVSLGAPHRAPESVAVKMINVWLKP